MIAKHAKARLDGVTTQVFSENLASNQRTQGHQSRQQVNRFLLTFVTASMIMQKHSVVFVLAASASCGEAQRPPATHQQSYTPSLKHHQISDKVTTPTSKDRATPLLATCVECGDCLEVMSTLMVATTPPTWLPGFETQGPCDMDADGLIAPDEYTETEHESGKASEGTFDLSYKGPAGSGRYWDVGLSFDDGDGRQGFCLLTSTVGWRHLGTNRELASTVSKAMWIQDVDADGDDELIIPESVQAGSHGSNSKDAIVLTAYDRVKQGFVLDVESTLALRASIGDAYQKAQKTDGISADDLEHFQEAELEQRRPLCATPSLN